MLFKHFELTHIHAKIYTQWDISWFNTTLVPTLHSNCVLHLKDFKYNIKFEETVNLW